MLVFSADFVIVLVAGVTVLAPVAAEAGLATFLGGRPGLRFSVATEVAFGVAEAVSVLASLRGRPGLRFGIWSAEALKPDETREAIVRAEGAIAEGVPLDGCGDDPFLGPPGLLGLRFGTCTAGTELLVLVRAMHSR